jgi:hypothetical protein
MNKHELINISLGVLFLIVIGLLVFTLSNLRNQGASCLADPLQYSANNIKEQIGEDIMCSCESADPKYNPLVRTTGGVFDYDLSSFEYSPSPIK